MFERYHRELLSFLSRKVSDRHVAADLAQESYARVYASQASGAAVADPRALLYQTARNLVIDHHRHNEVRGAVELPESPERPAEALAPCTNEPEVALASQQGLLALVSAIDGLPPRCREAFMLNRFEGMSQVQVAERMGISVKAVEQHIKHALDACERCRAASSGTEMAVLPRRQKLHRSRHG